MTRAGLVILLVALWLTVYPSGANGVDIEKQGIRLGPVLTRDASKESFTGADAEKANAMLKGSYRKGFEIVV